MSKKRSFFNIHDKLILASSILVVFLCGTALAIYIVDKRDATKVSQSPDLPTKMMIGTVIRKNLNGLDYVTDHTKLMAPGPSYGITHAENSISVDGEYFSPSNIRFIGLGDEVIVTYAIDESGEKTLRCRNCSVVRRAEYR